MSTAPRDTEASAPVARVKNDPWAVPAPHHREPVKPPPPRKRQRRRCYYAVAASGGEIDLPRLPPLGYLKQSRLIARAQAGDTAARHTVWLHHARLAYSVANRVRVRPALMADAIQEAQIGLNRAISLFGVDRLVLLATYAFTGMQRRLQRFRELCTYHVPIPSHVYPEYSRFHRRLERVRSRAEWFDLREACIEQDPAAYLRLVRLHAIANPLGLADARQAADPADGPPMQLLGKERRDAVHAAIDTLDPRDRHIVRRRYGLDGAAPATLQEVGDQLGITRERVRQLQQKAECTLRRILAHFCDAPATPPVDAADAPADEPADDDATEGDSVPADPPLIFGAQPLLPFPDWGTMQQTP